MNETPVTNDVNVTVFRENGETHSLAIWPDGSDACSCGKVNYDSPAAWLERIMSR